MIRAVRCNNPSFKNVFFEAGFNVILAERTQDSTKKDSRNGLGKSTLIEIIHFCLGSSIPKGALSSPDLVGWVFSLELLLGGGIVTASRDTSSPNSIIVEGDTQNWSIKPDFDIFGRAILSLDSWTTVLGELMFDLTTEENKKYSPHFRGLISYFARRGRDAFSSPFEHFRKQREYDIQVCNTFLLGLAWEDASELQVLKDKNEVISDLKKAAKTGVIDDVFGSVGELEARRVQLSGKYSRESRSLADFNVHNQYHDIGDEADRLTTEIQSLMNDNVSDTEWLTLYKSSVSNEASTALTTESLGRLYAEVGIELPDAALRRIKEVEAFHLRILENRKNFLESEITRLERALGERELEIRQKTELRARLMNILKSHGALEEYSRLQERNQETLTAIRNLDTQIENLRKFETGRNDLRIDQVLLQRRMQQDYDERQVQRDQAISQFNANSEALYKAPGTLIINVTPTGFKFSVEIERSGSAGIENMKVFCYDLMLAQLWSQKATTPGFLIHDSIIFDGVDERQVANALELAAQEANQKGFQYICTFNSDAVPRSDFSQEFDLNPYVRLCLTDATEDGGLLGKRF